MFQGCRLCRRSYIPNPYSPISYEAQRASQSQQILRSKATHLIYRLTLSLLFRLFDKEITRQFLPRERIDFAARGALGICHPRATLLPCNAISTMRPFVHSVSMMDSASLHHTYLSLGTWWTAGRVQKWLPSLIASVITPLLHLNIRFTASSMSRRIVRA